MNQEETTFSTALRHTRRVIVGVVGGTVLLVGISLLVLPGPAFVVIPAGLGILALEFAWARRWLRTVKERAELAMGTSTPPTPPEDHRDE